MNPVPVPSESRVLSLAVKILREVTRELPFNGEGRETMEKVIGMLTELRHNAQLGLHANPPLTVFGMNPPRLRRRWRQRERVAHVGKEIELVGEIGEGVYDIRYKHADDGKDYEHKFEQEEVKALAVLFGSRRAVLLVGPEDIWDDY